jgi:hypothetical protein
LPGCYYKLLEEGDNFYFSGRQNTMRDGVADYVLLCMLRENDPAAAIMLVSKHVQSIDKYNCDVKSFRQTRR